MDVKVYQGDINRKNDLVLNGNSQDKIHIRNLQEISFHVMYKSKVLTIVKNGCKAAQ